MRYWRRKGGQGRRAMRGRGEVGSSENMTKPLGRRFGRRMAKKIVESGYLRAPSPPTALNRVFVGSTYGYLGCIERSFSRSKHLK